MSAWDNAEETPEEEEVQSEEVEEAPEFMVMIETQWQASRRWMWAYAEFLFVSSMFANYWLASTIGGTQFWVGAAVCALLSALLSLMTYQAVKE